MGRTLFVCLYLCSLKESFGFSIQPHQSRPSTAMMATTAATIPSWSDLKKTVGETSVGNALNEEETLRLEGKGSAHVSNKLRTFDSGGPEPQITLFRDVGEFIVVSQKKLEIV